MKPRKKELGDRNLIGANVTRLRKLYHISQKELAINANITWPEIKQTLIDELKVQVTAAKSAGTLPV